MKRKITKTIVIISAVSVILGILLCIAGAAGNGNLGRALESFGIITEHDRGDGYDRYSGSFSIDGYDFYDDFFDDEIGDIFDEFNTRGGENNETSL